MMVQGSLLIKGMERSGKYQEIEAYQNTFYETLYPDLCVQSVTYLTPETNLLR